MPHAHRACYTKKRKKREKDAYPKKVCHMPTRHVRKKKKEKKIAHIQERREMVHDKEFIHHPPKKEKK